MNCPSIDQLSDLYDGALPRLIGWRIRHHLAGCAECAHRFAHEERMGRLLRQSSADKQASPAMRLAVIAALASPVPSAARIRSRPVRLVGAFGSAVAGAALIGFVLLRPL